MRVTDQVLWLILGINIYEGEFVIRHFEAQRPLFSITASWLVGASFYFALVGERTVSKKEQSGKKKATLACSFVVVTICV